LTCEACSMKLHSTCEGPFCICDECDSYAKNIEILDAAKIAAEIMLGGESKIVEAKPVHARIKGELVIENKITVFKVVSVPEYNQYQKLECKVQCNDDGKTEGLWQLNGQSTNALIAKFGKETLQWVNKSIPVTTKQFDSGIGIMVDSPKLEGIIA